MHRQVLQAYRTHMHATGFFLLFFLSIDGVELGKGPDVPWGILFAQAKVAAL